MIAASSLVVAVLATYASVAVLSLSAAAPFSVVGNLPGVQALVKGIGWNSLKVGDVINAKAGGPAGSVASAPLADQLIYFAPSNGTRSLTQSVSITNTAKTPLKLTLTVEHAPGVTAVFPNGLTKMTVAKSASVTLTSSPMVAGVISGSLQIGLDGSSATALSIPINGAQAPLAPAAVTATPAAGGAVNVSWAASLSSGVSGYIVQRSLGASGAWQQVGSVTSATSLVDQTSTDATYSYRVVAEAPGIGAPVTSDPSPLGSATADSTAPDPPSSINAPQYINIATGNSMSIPVALDNASVASDTITVTLTDSTGFSVSGHASGGAATVRVPIAGLNQLAEGKVKVSATAADSLGNVSNAVAGDNPITKDTTAPDAPVLGDVPVITSQNVTSVQVPVSTTSPAAAGDVITVQMSDGANTTPSALIQQNAGDDGGVASVNASNLSDSLDISVTATVTDAAGNVSQPASASTSMDTTAPAAPTSIGVAAGPNNPAGVVTAASQSAVIVQATFDQPPPISDTMVIWVAGTAYPVTPDGQSTTYTLPPIDLSGLSDGVYNVGIKETDANGNITRTWRTFQVDTGGPVAAASVGVPAGPNNPAGYVNAATQTAATIVAAFAAPTDPADQIALTVDGMPFGTQPGGSDQIVFSGDMSSLPDGVLQIQGTITDANGVSSTFSGTLTKDTRPPPAPAAAYVVGPPPNTIGPADASCVKVAVVFNQAPDPSDTVTATLSDGSTSISGSAPAGDGQVLISCIDASSLTAGSIAVNVTVTDAAGNSTSVAGTTATKLPCPTN